MLLRYAALSLVLGLSMAGTSPLMAQAGTSESHHPLQARRVLLISVDGLHAVDLDKYVTAHPHSALAGLTSHGLTYTNAYTPTPSDSFPGILALTTGGTPYSTGIFYDDKWDRSLLPSPQQIAGGQANTPGTEVQFAENIDKGFPNFLGDPTTYAGASAIDVGALPLDPITKKPVWPHNHLRVNTIFEVIHEAGHRTAWTDKHPAYEMLNGPSGKGIDDLYTPEVNAPNPATPGKDYTKSVTSVITYDTLKVNATLNQIKGRDHTGTVHLGVPTIFGMNFQAVSVGQKLANNGYTDALGNPSAGLETSLDFVDASLGKMVDALKDQGLYESTLVVISAKHGQSPVDPNAVNRIDDGLYTSVLAAAGTPEAFHMADDFCMIWLQDQSKTAAAVAVLDTPANRNALGIARISAGSDITTKYQNPLTDSRTPDIIIQSATGVIYTGGSKIAEHGGSTEDDTHVALLLSMPQVKAKRIHALVQTPQVAPTILRSLGLDADDLKAVQIEHTPILPATF
jgi:predicted AlkP superfamily pyrophosphatase or phosphodiesterase